ncbi:hypothetical protein Cpir12675_006479 [Ceratocystis pirilliformis]|uniref:Uncharacterized protein n=1 Tax=Ceratocystis pirilliformis TaxID=259994 RepID=A0ABR3YIG7_9PEZI
MLLPPTTPFILHIIIETLAGFSFTLAPLVQLPNASEPGQLLVQSYGGTLLSTVLVSLIFVIRPEGLDATAKMVAAAFAFGHIWPCHRALGRIHRGDALGGIFGGPVVHLSVHMLMVGLFAYVAMTD